MQEVEDAPPLGLEPAALPVGEVRRQLGLGKLRQLGEHRARSLQALAPARRAGARRGRVRRPEQGQRVAQQPPAAGCVRRAQRGDERPRLASAEGVARDAGQDGLLIGVAQAAQRVGQTGPDPIGVHGPGGHGAELARQCQPPADPIGPAPQQRRDRLGTEPVVVAQRGDDPRLVEGRERPARSVSPQQRALGLGHAQPAFDQDPGVRGARAAPALEALEAVEDLVVSVVAGEHAQGELAALVQREDAAPAQGRQAGAELGNRDAAQADRVALGADRLRAPLVEGGGHGARRWGSESLGPAGVGLARRAADPAQVLAELVRQLARWRLRQREDLVVAVGRARVEGRVGHQVELAQAPERPN